MINDAGTSAAEAAVRAAELARFKAQTTGDLKALDALLGDELVYTHSSAAVDSKASYVESMRSGALKYQTIEPRDIAGACIRHHRGDYRGRAHHGDLEGPAGRQPAALHGCLGAARRPLADGGVAEHADRALTNV